MLPFIIVWGSIIGFCIVAVCLCRGYESQFDRIDCLVNDLTDALSDDAEPLLLDDPEWKNDYEKAMRDL